MLAQTAGAAENAWLPLTLVMATYNGERFLEAQLASLINQSMWPTEMIVSDDGSTDATLDILNQFAQASPFPVKVIRSGRLGFADNFLNMAAQATGSWIAFCDQDDVWLPGKLEQAACAIRGAPRSLMLIVQGMRLVDEALRPLPQQTLVIRKPHNSQPLDQHGFWVWPGFCLTARADLITKIPFKNRPPGGMNGRGIAHDRWICVLANSLGTTTFLPGAAALYRRHGGSIMIDAESRNAEERNLFDEAAERASKASQLETLGVTALNFAACLRTLSVAVFNAEWAISLETAACRYEALAKVKFTRSRIYTCRSRIRRLSSFFSVAAAGGYSRRGFVGEGRRSLVSDARTCLRSR